MDNLKKYSNKELIDKISELESRLRESELALKRIDFQAQLLSDVHDAVFSSDKNYIITYWNQAAERLYGWSKEEVLGKNSGELLKPIVSGSSVGKERSKLRNEGHWEGDVQYLRKDGTYLLVEVNSTTLKSPDGTDIGNVVISRDITERKKSEKLIFHQKSILETINGILEAAVTYRSQYDLGIRCLELAQKITDSKFGFIGEINKDGLEDIAISNPGWDICKILSGEGHQIPASGFKIHGIYGRVLKDGKSLFTNDPSNHPDSIGLPAGHPPLESVLGVPLIHESKAIGIIVLCNRPGGYSEVELETIERIAPVIVEAFLRMKSDESLTENAKLLKSVLENVNSGVALIDEYGYFSLYNPLFLKLFGLSENSTIKNVNDQNWSEWQVFNEDGTLLDVDDHPVRKAAITGKRVNQQLAGVKLPSGGDMIWMLISAEPVFNNNNKIERFICTYHDVSSSIKAKNELKEAQTRLTLALENGNIGVWEWDLITGEVYWDERLEKMFNLKPGEFGGSLQAFEQLVNEEDLTHVRKITLEAIEKDIALETIFRVKSTSSSAKYISTKALVTKNINGKPISLSGVCFDITSLREGTENLVIKLNEDLLRSNKDLESFAYAASHDLQEPLRMVTSFTQLLELQYKENLDERGIEYIHFAVDGANRMYELINGLLAFSRVNTKGKTFAQIDLNKVINIVKKNLLLQITESNAIINHSELPIVFADESQMILLFQNLIANSIKFSNDSPRIDVYSTSDEKCSRIIFRDEGIGIESQYFEKIFQIFQRLNSRETYEGTGIGLAICKRIVERHGGKIWVESQLGFGSTFLIELPKIVTEANSDLYYLISKSN